MVRPRARFVLGVAGIVAGAFFFAGSARAGVPGQISGTVRDAGTGQPVALASVAIPELKRGSTTDAKGNYFILNLPPGKYTVRVTLLGYVPQVREGVEVFADFNTKLDFNVESTVLKNVEPVEVQAQRPLIQKDVTTTTKFLDAQDLQNQPLRGYQDAVAQQSGVVNFKQNIGAEAQNNNTLIIRGGRPNEVAYYVDGFSQQDPLSGVATTSISSDAVNQIVVQSGGFNAEYGRINSGVINVVTREGADHYFGSFEAVSDNLSGSWNDAPSMDSNIYGASFGGPLTPSTKQVTFYFAGERIWDRDRSPSVITADMADPSQPGLFSDGVLPSNWSSSWLGNGKIAWKPSPTQTLKVGGTYNNNDWQQYLNVYRYDLNHAPKYEDTNWSVYTNWSHSLSDKTFYELAANVFTTERARGDGQYMNDLQAYARDAGDPTYDPNEALFWYGDQSVDSEGNPTGAHVWDDYLKRYSKYYGFSGSYSTQMTKSFQFKGGGDFQYQTLRFYQHYFPTKLYYEDGTPRDTRNVDHYGYDVFGNKSDGGDSFTDSNGNGAYDLGEPFVDTNQNGVYDDPLDGAKHPKVASLYAQGKYEQLGLVVNAGIRWDYLTPATYALRSEDNPLDPEGLNDSHLTQQDLQPSKVYSVFSPRLGVGFPVSDQTLVHVNYGKFFQQPDLQNLYVSYEFLEYKIKTGNYFVGFGNPNLKPEQTTAYEIGLQHTPTENSSVNIVAYYKSVKNLVEIVNVPSFPNAFSSYRNTDFATIRGLDLGYTLRRTGNFTASANYSLSYASGTGSVSNTQRNIAWTASEPPKMTSPLAYDQRHKFSFDLDYRYGKGQGPTWGSSHFLENAGLNILMNLGSGTPYTPTTVYNAVTLAAVAVQPAGQINSRYGPWTFEVDLKLNKTVDLKGQSLDLYLWTLNVFNTQNETTVYTTSGSANSTNWLNTAEGQAWVAANADAYGGPEGAAQHYHLAELDPALYGIPRQVRFGAKLSF
jgi:outer membrane receptor protein involved in Fe transport